MGSGHKVDRFFSVSSFLPLLRHLAHTEQYSAPLPSHFTLGGGNLLWSNTTWYMLISLQSFLQSTFFYDFQFSFFFQKLIQASSHPEVGQPRIVHRYTLPRNTQVTETYSFKRDIDFGHIYARTTNSQCKCQIIVLSTDSAKKHNNSLR